MRVHVASGVGRGPTETAAYDAALAAAGVGDYNLVVVSSVLPADATVVERDRVPPVGAAGDRLTVVQARATAAVDEGPDRLAAGLGWATGPGPGLLYEATGSDPAAVREAVDRGLAAGCALRDWRVDDRTVRVRTAPTAPEPGSTPTPTPTPAFDGDAAADDGRGAPGAAADPVVVGEPRHACVVHVAAYGRGEPIA